MSNHIKPLTWCLFQGASNAVQYILESMPALSELGTEYTSFPLHYGGDDGGYEVRVIAVEDDTDVTVPAFSVSLTLNVGEFYTINNTLTRAGFRISCSKPCQAVQYVQTLPPGGPTDMPMATFLAVLTPDGQSSNSLIFTVPRMMNSSSDMVAAVSIITNTFPVTGLYLNETSLADLDWQPVEDSTNWFATVEIETGFYQMFSVESSERCGIYYVCLPCLHVLSSCVAACYVWTFKYPI